MKRIFTIILTLAALLTGTRAQQTVMSVPSQKGGISVRVAIDDVVIGQSAPGQVGLQMSLTLLSQSVSRQHVVVVTPRLVAGAEYADFPSVNLYGKWTYYQIARSGTNDNEPNMQLRAQDAHTSVKYSKAVAYQPWMENAELQFVVSEQDGCGSVLGSSDFSVYAREPLSNTRALQGAHASATAADSMMASTNDVHQYQGTAYITFPVDRTELKPDFNGNARELDGIARSIDSLTQHNRALLRHITLKGFASPEGSYAHNEELARGRMHSLRNYLVQHYDLSDMIISTDYEPEDWEGLRRHVAASQYPERDELLRIIDNPQDPDVKLARIATTYPTLYKKLLNEVFPTLRRTDYRLDYVAVDTVNHIGPMGHISPIGPIGHTSPIGSSSPSAFVCYPYFEEMSSQFSTYRPLFAVKSNLLFDVLAAPNIEVEVPFGRWSVMAEVWFPWWRLSYNELGKQNKYYRSDQRPTKHAYQLLTVGAEARYWLAPRCKASRPCLSGAFVGLYAAGGKYDLGYDGTGDQGEFTSFGISAGYSWPVARHWNIELSAAVGYVGGPKVHYQNEFDDARLIYRSNNNLRYFGPTKLKVSLVWLIGKAKK